MTIAFSSYFHELPFDTIQHYSTTVDVARLMKVENTFQDSIFVDACVGDHKCETTKSVARCGTRWNIPRRWCLYINSSSPTAYFE
jgi:hypothetical protein